MKLAPSTISQALTSPCCPDIHGFCFVASGAWAWMFCFVHISADALMIYYNVLLNHCRI